MVSTDTLVHSPRTQPASRSPRAKARETVPYAVTLPGELAEVSFMLKDSKRFPKTNGWGYATFQYDAASDRWKAKGDNADFVNACHGCHAVVKARDFVFTHYAKR
jgi:1,4-alpha-glucan branching enzyme